MDWAATSETTGPSFLTEEPSSVAQGLAYLVLVRIEPVTRDTRVGGFFNVRERNLKWHRVVRTMVPASKRTISAREKCVDRQSFPETLFMASDAVGISFSGPVFLQTAFRKTLLFY